VIVNVWSFHNDPDFWGDPEVFRPERFLDEKGQLLKKDYSLPFGAGQWRHVQYEFSLIIRILRFVAWGLR
jgi:cytochrome P450